MRDKHYTAASLLAAYSIPEPDRTKLERRLTVALAELYGRIAGLSSQVDEMLQEMRERDAEQLTAPAHEEEG